MKKGIIVIGFICSLVIVSCSNDTDSILEGNDMGIATEIDNIQAEQGSIEQGQFATEGDSLLAYYRKKIMCEYLNFDKDTNLRDSHINNLFVEFMGGELDQGHIVQSPDSVFTIYSYQGESCGAYCNPYWEAYMWVNTPNGELIKRLKYAYVNQVYLIDKGMYLITEWSNKRVSSAKAVECETVRLISFDHPELIEHTIFKNEKTFGFCQEINGEVEDSPYLTYEEYSKKLKYLYYTTAADGKAVSVVEGALKYENGTFIQDFETIKNVNENYFCY